MCITFWYSLNILIIRRNQSDELLKYLQSGSTLYFEAIKNLRRLGWSRAQLIYDYNHDFQSQASFQTFWIFRYQTTFCVFFPAFFFVWWHFSWKLRDKFSWKACFFEAHFWIGLKCDPSCKLYKKAYHIRNSLAVLVSSCWKTLMDHCVSLNTPSR